jgi:hypothetical protein
VIDRRGLLACAAGLAACAAGPAWAQAAGPAPAVAASSPMGEVVSLGQERYRIGRIVVDKAKGSFVVPGRVLVTGKPLEYLATSPGGVKAYESMLELDATGSEFNLACILVGLDKAGLKTPWREFRAHPRIVAQKLTLSLAWSDAGRRRQMPAAEALLNAEAGVAAASVEWVYTGSPVSEGTDRFAADATGTLIGFVHDANTIIESAAPIGLGAYGAVRGHAVLPPVGTAIELIVEVRGARK